MSMTGRLKSAVNGLIAVQRGNAELVADGGVASVYSTGISEILASPFRIFAAILPVVTPRS